MKNRRSRLPFPAILAATALLAAAPASALDLTERELSGKRVYLTGESPTGGEIVVKLGRDGSTLPGSAAPCGSCHGADGQGRPEGGVRPSAVVWSELTKPYGHSHLGGRKHPPFTDATLARSLRDGLDPAGNPLDVSMPRYAISDDDLGSLLAYLRRLEEDLDPGITSGGLRIGTVLPTSGALADVGLPMRAVLSGWFDALNLRGGVHGRKIQLVVAGYDSDRADGVEAARELLRQGDVFALVSGLFPAAEPEVAVLVGEARVPMVGPFSLFARNDDVAGPWIFHPSGGLGEQARVLAAFAVRDLGAGAKRIALVHAPEAPYAEAARGAAEELRRRGGPAPEMMVFRPEPKELADRLAKGGFAAVLVLAGDGALTGLARVLADGKAAPALLASGTLSGRAATELAGRYPGAVYLAFPSSPSNESPAVAQEFARLREAAGSPGRSRASQASAVVDAMVLVEGLKRSGRALSRERLVASLEALYAFETGLSPPVTFGPDRRVGALGAYVVRVDPAARAFVPVGGWIPLD
jgi:ABC-type branched-subunit amino acid transport system substrate-binding protein